MISEKGSKYKSWSSLKKQMQDFLCDALKGKISYYYTTYDHSGGLRVANGRASINYHKKELVAFSWDLGGKQWDDEYAVLRSEDINARSMGSFQALWEKQRQVEDALMKEKWMPEGILCDHDFTFAVTTYLNTDVSTSLHSDNYLLRVFAYMDRRVGKRTLVKIKDEAEALPEWVKQFYRIRCEAEGILNRITDGTDVFLNRQKAEHNMKLNSAPFAMIKSGQKTIELRLFDEKRQQIQPGDAIVFTNTATDETLTATVVKLHRFNNFEELYKTLPLLKCGYTTEDIDTAHPADMEQYYSLEEQEKYGVVGIEISLVQE